MQPFNEAKATQAAALILKLRGGKMSYMKLIKILYLVDREALLRWGRPVTNDSIVSMDRGQVLSRTLDLINEGSEPNHPSVWAEYISGTEGYDVALKKEAPTDELSEAEERLIEELFAQYGNKSRWELVDIHHNLPEWQDPQGGAIPITYRDILRAAKKSELEIAAIEEELRHLGLVNSILSVR